MTRSVVSAGQSRHAGAGEIIAVFPRGRVRIRWPDGTERMRSVSTLRVVP